MSRDLWTAPKTKKILKASSVWQEKPLITTVRYITKEVSFSKLFRPDEPWAIWMTVLSVSVRLFSATTTKEASGQPWWPKTWVWLRTPPPGRRQPLLWARSPIRFTFYFPRLFVIWNFQIYRVMCNAGYSEKDFSSAFKFIREQK